MVNSSGWGNWVWEKAAFAWDITKDLVEVSGAVTATVAQIAIENLVYPAASVTKGLYNVTAKSLHNAHTIGKIFYDCWGAVDAEDGVQKLNIDKRVKDRYHQVQPSIVEKFYHRFGADCMVSLERLTTIAQKKIPQLNSTVGVAFGNVIRVDFQTLALGTATWVSDKIKKAIPDDNEEARSQFAISVATDLTQATDVFEKTTASVRRKGHDITDPEFVTEYNKLFEDSDMAKAVGQKRDFYEKLAIRVLARLENELPENMEPHIASALKAASIGVDEMVSTSFKKEQLVDLFMKIDEMLTDRTRIKEWLILILDKSSDSMEENYRDFIDRIDSTSWWIPFKQFFNARKKEERDDGSVRQRYGAAYGNTIMNLLQTLQPKVLGFNALGSYRTLVGKKKIKAGNDFLSALMRDSTGAAIEQLMKSNTDLWAVGAIKLAEAQLFDRYGKFIERPGHIQEDVWNEFTAEQKLQARDPEGLIYKELKLRHIKEVDQKLLDSSKRLAKNVFRAGLVLEQFLDTPSDVANDEKQSVFVRALAGAWSFIIGLPVVNLFFNCVHRLSIFIRGLISDRAGDASGKSIDERLDKFLETKSLDVLVMHMMERMLDKLDVLDDPKATKSIKSAEETAPLSEKTVSTSEVSVDPSLKKEEV